MAAKKPKPETAKTCKECGQVSPPSESECLYCGATL